jgi:hypothetical protein
MSGRMPDTERRATIRRTKNKRTCLSAIRPAAERRTLVRAADVGQPSAQPMRQYLQELPGDLDQFLDRLDRVIKHLLLLGIQLDFNDPLDAAAPRMTGTPT